jgi:predicted GH43/DUF377 family glycosyl hydrolase
MRLLGLAIVAAFVGVNAWQFGPFVRPTHHPLISPNASVVFECPLTPGPVQWEALHTFNPGAIVKDDKIHVLYRAEDNYNPTGGIGSHISRIGLAIAEDETGTAFRLFDSPVLYPANDSQQYYEWRGGCEDPRVVENDGKYYVFYTQYSREHSNVDLAVASSTDLFTWEKHGSVFVKAHGNKYTGTKSGAVVTKVSDEGDRLVAAVINGKYWMYWGDSHVRLAWSPDLLDWTVVEHSAGNAVPMLPIRPGKFDSLLSEAGPPGILTSDGIVVFYNGQNADPADGKGDPNLPKLTYSAGQALFSAEDPTKLLQRPETPFFKPEEDWEKTGQYAAGTTFIEGLVLYKNQLHLYYGAADSFVGTAIAPFSTTALSLQE